MRETEFIPQEAHPLCADTQFIGGNIDLLCKLLLEPQNRQRQVRYRENNGPAFCKRAANLNLEYRMMAYVLVNKE